MPLPDSKLRGGADRRRGFNGPVRVPHSVPGRNRANRNQANGIHRCRRPKYTGGGVKAGAGATLVLEWQRHPKPSRVSFGPAESLPPLPCPIPDLKSESVSSSETASEKEALHAIADR